MHDPLPVGLAGNITDITMRGLWNGKPLTFYLCGAINFLTHAERDDSVTFAVND